MKTKAPDDLKKLIEVVLKFRDERDWKQFHTPKDLAMGISIEAGELLEHFLWKDKKGIEQVIKEKKKEIGDELSDVLHGVLLLSESLNIDLVTAFHEKMKQNAKKYPAEKVKGKSRKYTEY
jgi:NTP pyrophosphatase (non-canonical NTP hydrolase)